MSYFDIMPKYDVGRKTGGDQYGYDVIWHSLNDMATKLQSCYFAERSQAFQIDTKH